MPTVLFANQSQGATWLWPLQALEEDTDDPIPGLSAATSMSCGLARRAGDTPLLASLVEVTDDAEGMFNVTWNTDKTTQVDPGLWWSDVKFAFADGTVQRFGPFAISVRAPITT